MKRMAFHHLYKTLTFARTNSREQDLENNTERKYEQYGSQKKKKIWTLYELSPANHDAFLHPTSFTNKAAYM